MEKSVSLPKPLGRLACWILVLTGLMLQASCSDGGGGGGGGGVPPENPGGPTQVLPASFTAQPSDRSVAEGGATSFSVTAANAASLQWQRSADQGATWSDVAAATSATYTTPATTQAMDGTLYRVVARGAGGDTVFSSAARLTVTSTLQAAVVLVSPASLTVVAGSPAQFNVTANGSQLSYAWQRSTDGGGSWVDLSFPSLPTLTLQTTATSDDGQLYRVLVANSLGTVTSAEAMLRVQVAQAAPVVTRQPTDQSVVVGGTARFSVVATGNPNPSYQWQQSTDGVSWVAAAGTTSAGTITLDSVTLALNALQLRALVSNGAGSVTSQAATLTVNAAAVAPAFSQTPTGTTVAPGQPVALTAVATGSPTPTLQWQLALPGSNSFGNVQGATGPSYTSEALALVDSGRRYRVVASNSAGQATSAPAAVTVGIAPTVTLGLSLPSCQCITVAGGDTVTLNAQATGSPPPALQWSVNGSPVPGATGPSFTTAAVASQSQLRVTVSALNGVGSQASDSVTIQGQAQSAPVAHGSSPPVAVVTGSPVSFVCSAFLGLPQAAIQWQTSMDGVTWVDMSGQTAAVLTLAQTTVADNGRRFRYVLTNRVGTSTSGPMPLIVGDATGPQQRVLGGERLAAMGSTLPSSTIDNFGTVTGIPTPTLVFQSSTDGGNTWQTKDAAARNAPLVSADEGRLDRWLARNSVGESVQHPTRVRLLRDPVSEIDWRSWPADITVPEGSIAQFEALINSVRRLDPAGASVSWQSSADGGQSWQEVTSAVSGAVGGTSALTGGTRVVSLQTLPTRANDNGKLYRLSVSFQGGNWTSGSARLTVTPSPTNTQLSLLAGAAGGRGTLDGSLAQTRFRRPVAAARDAAGNLYVLEVGNEIADNIRQVTPAGDVRTLYIRNGSNGGTFHLNSLAAAPDGTLYYASPNKVWRRAPDGTETIFAGGGVGDGQGTAAGFDAITALAFAPDGGLAVTEGAQLYSAPEPPPPSQCVRRITSAGLVTTLAGRCGVRDPSTTGMVDGPGASARFHLPTSVVVASDGVIYVADYNNQRIRRVAADGTTSTLVGAAGGGGRPPYSDGTLSTSRLAGPTVLAINGNGLLALVDAVPTSFGPGSKTVRIVDIANNQVRRLAGRDGVACGLDDGPGSSASFCESNGLVDDGQGGWFLLDSATSSTGLYPRGPLAPIDNAAVVRRIAANGTVSTLAGQRGRPGSADGAGAAATFQRPQGLAADAAGTLYVADPFDHTIRRVDRLGNATVLAGQPGQRGSSDGTGSAARFNRPTAVALAADGALFVADAGNHAIRRVASNGAVTTLAGSAGQLGSVDGLGAAARFESPMSLAVLPGGAVAVADLAGLRIVQPNGQVTTRWRIADNGRNAEGRIGQVSAVAANAAGDVFIAAQQLGILRISTSGTASAFSGGAGLPGRCHGDGLARSAEFGFVTAMAFDASGRLLVADGGGTSLRRVAPDGRVVTLMGGTNSSMEYWCVPGYFQEEVARSGVTLGSQPNLSFVGGLAFLPDGTVALSMDHGLFVATVP